MLMDDLIPQVKAAPVAANWLEPVDVMGVAIASFETQAQARLVAPPVGSGVETGGHRRQRGVSPGRRQHQKLSEGRRRELRLTARNKTNPTPASSSW